VNDAALGHGVTFSNPGSVTMGPSCFINNQVYFDAGPVVLGRSVTVGPRTMFITANHSLGPADHRAGDGNHCGITVGDGSWIGAGVIVLPGVTIGPGCVIGAGAVVVTDCEAHGIYTGVPARRLRDLDPGVPSGRGAREL
jgi:acetyltransferase-like isoleucine patch superfamily enzyme